MDYEKKYKNALTIAQSRFKIEKDESVLTCLGMMFPELRESEEERIRKELLDFVRSFWADHKEKLPQVSRWVTYLEKQKQHDAELIEIAGNEGGRKMNDYDFIKNAIDRKQCYNCALRKECEQEHPDTYEPISTCDKWTK